MSDFLGGLFIALVVGGFFGCGLLGLAACMRSSQISRDEEAGAPEGAFSVIHLHVEKNR